MTDFGVRQLSAAILMRAVRDYCHAGASVGAKRAILKDLRSDWMDFLTGGQSLVIAEQLEKNRDEIAKRLNIYEEDEL